MLYGGVQDILLYFSPELALVPSWHPVPPLVGLICGLIVLASAGLNVVWGWELRCSEGAGERRLAYRVALASGMAMVADWTSGYYGFGSLMALLTGIWLLRR